MLIRDDADAGWTAITQPAHAHLAGQVARAWSPEPPAAVLLGIEQHDVAWTEWDLLPPLHAPAGRAATFYEAPADRRLAIWADVGARVEALSPHAAVLVSLHGTNIHTRYLEPEHRPQELLDAARAEQDRLLALLPDLTRAEAEAQAELLFACDALSLTICFGWDGRELPPVDGITITVAPAAEARDVYTLDPWPLRVETLTVAAPARTLTERFDDEAAMQAALAATPFTQRTWTLRPA